MKKLTDILKQINEESSVGGGTTAGANMTPGTGEQVGTTKGFKPIRKKLSEEESEFKIGDKVKYGNQEWEIIGLIPDHGTARLKSLKGLPNTTVLVSKLEKSTVSEDAPMLAAGKADTKTYTQDGFTLNPSVPNRKSKAIDYKQILEIEEVLNENYARFRNQTKSRKGPDQFHQAIREAKKKVAEVNKIMEYVEKLRNELNEGENGLKYRKHTENAITQIKESVVKLYKKIKSFN
jgi:hypothetical protein